MPTNEITVSVIDLVSDIYSSRWAARKGHQNLGGKSMCIEKGRLEYV